LIEIYNMRNFFVFSLILISFTSYCQSLACGYASTQTQGGDPCLNEAIYSTSNCTNQTFSGQNPTYRLILEYSKSQYEAKEIVGFAEQVKEHYDDIGIKLQIMILESSCSNCIIDDDANWWQDFNNNGVVDQFPLREDYNWTNHPFSNCVYGRIIYNNPLSPFDPNGGRGCFLNSSFWSSTHNVLLSHELGHALGLTHTFHNFKAPSSGDIAPASNESITQDGSSSCKCNCAIAGDNVRDTPVNPHAIEDINGWNSTLFNVPIGAYITEINQAFFNTKRDACGELYKTMPNQSEIFSNIMSYWTSTSNKLTDGQGDRIKISNQNKPIVASGPEFIIVQQANYNITQATTIDYDLFLAHDLNVSNNLTFKNCTVYVNAEKKINLKNGAKLTLDNAKIVKFDQESCLATPGEWAGINVSGRADIRIKNNSVIKDVKEKAISSINSTALIYMTSDSKIDMPNKIAFDLAGGTNYLQATKCIINGDIKIKNTGKLDLWNTEVNANTIDLDNIICNITTGSKIRGSVNIKNNIGSKTVYYSNSYFYSNHSIENSNSVTKIIDSKFYGSNPLTMKSAKDYDLYNNEFYTCTECVKINGLNNQSKSLIAKNKFFTSANALQVDATSLGLSLECNTMSGTTGIDWMLNQAIASKQGDDQFAAGNFFSRAPVEIEYNSNSVVDYSYRKLSMEEPLFITGSNITLFRKFEATQGSRCDFIYPRPPEYPSHCTNGIKDINESGIDCGGSCKPCIIIDTDVAPVGNCDNGIKDGDETGIDCGGTYCTPCSTCNDGIKNNGETGVDCGGPVCPPCFTGYCSNGMQDNGETGIDCGGTCPPCITNGNPPNNDSCHNGVQDNGESGIDCGGNCPPCNAVPITYNPSSNSGTQDNGETDVDCGGTAFVPCNCDQYFTDAYGQALLSSRSQFLSHLSQAYGSSIFPPNTQINPRLEQLQYEASLDNGNTSTLINNIKQNSSLNTSNILATLDAMKPNVSTKVIHTIFSQSDHYSKEEVFNIIKNNPVVVYDRYIAYMVYESGLFTQAERNQINLSLTVQSNRSIAFEKMRIRHHYYQHVLRNYIIEAGEGNSPNYKAITCLLHQQNDPETIYEFYSNLVSAGQYQVADQYLSSLDADDQTDPYLKNQLIQYKILHNLLMKYYYAGNKYLQMSNSDSQILNNIATSCYGRASLLSAKVLNELNGALVSYNSCLGYLPITFKSSPRYRYESDNYVSISPNPTDYSLNIEIRDYNTKENYSIDIYNTFGQKLISNSIKSDVSAHEITNLESGIYYINIKEGSNIIFSTKLIKLE
jgi:hypothetical protein